jgi:hypothetical protein
MVLVYSNLASSLYIPFLTLVSLALLPCNKILRNWANTKEMFVLDTLSSTSIIPFTLAENKWFHKGLDTFLFQFKIRIKKLKKYLCFFIIFIFIFFFFFFSGVWCHDPPHPGRHGHWSQRRIDAGHSTQKTPQEVSQTKQTQNHFKNQTKNNKTYN